jgi:hypothetical protein
MRTILAAVILCLWASGALAADDGFTAFGVGLDSCATWLSNRTYEYIGGEWILGFWSGLNAAHPNESVVGKDSDSAGLIAEVKRVCETRPTDKLMLVVLDVYLDFKIKGK